MTPLKRIAHDKRRMIWPLGLVLVANLAVLGLVVYPLSNKVATGEQDAEAASAELLAARREYANARATVTGKSQADSELAKFYQDVLPPDLSGARRITYLPLEQFARQAKLRLDRQTSDYEAIRESALVKYTQTAILIGEYRDIRRFIHRIETAPEFVVIENVALAQNENESNRGITVTLQIATYFRAGGDGN